MSFRYFAVVMSVIGVLATPSVLAEPMIINLNAGTNNASNPVQVFLESGTYIVEPIGTDNGGTYNAWNAWGSTTCSDTNGCPTTSPTTWTGWLNSYNFSSQDISAVTVDDTPIDAENSVYSVVQKFVYPDELSALAVAPSSVFTLNTSGTVEFYINDPSSELSNNLGGISRQISLFKCGDAVITPSNISHSSSSETGTVTVSASSDCSWTARSNVDWVTITAGESGEGDGTVSYSIMANPYQSREGTISIAGKTFIISQEGDELPSLSFDEFKANWKFSGIIDGDPIGFQPELTDYDYDDSSWELVDISEDYVPNSSNMYWFVRKKFYLEAGSITFSGNVDDDEIWTLIAPSGEYIEIGGDANDNDGQGAHSFSHTFTVTSPGLYIWAGRGHEGGGEEHLEITEVTGLELIHDALACSNSIITPTSLSHNANAESGTVAISTSPFCAWTANSNENWITITAGESGKGDGTISYAITANRTNQSREGTLTIAGQTFTITQEGGECSYSISPGSRSHSSKTETGEVSVDTSYSDCPWTASSDIAWANITSDSSGKGDGTVTYAIMENSGGTREGTLTIAGQTFTLTQGCNELFFSGLKDFYAVSEFVELDLVSCVTSQIESADLWVAIMIPNGEIFFMTDDEGFSRTPQYFKKSVENTGQTYPLLQFEVPPDLGGGYTFYALYVKEGKNPVTDDSSVYLSNVAIAETLLSNQPPLTQTPGEMFQDTLQDGSIGPEMVWIPAGTFRMGDIQGDGYSNELPVHEVSMDDFAMGRYEVTFAEYDKFAEATGRAKPDDQGWGRGNRPVINVSWNDGVAYANWLSQQTDKHYRLPTGAEWEYVARAGTESKYWWGNEIGTNQANCQNSDCGDSFDYTAPVGSFEPNPFGVYDMAGNVWEWSCSSYDSRYNGQEEVCATEQPRVVRGGSWRDSASYCRSAFHSFLSPDLGGDTFGFRLVRMADSK